MYESINTYINSLHTTIAIKYISSEYTNYIEENLQNPKVVSDEIYNFLISNKFNIVKEVSNDTLLIIKFIYKNTLATIYSPIFVNYLNREYSICKSINVFDQYFGPYIDEIYILKSISFSKENENIKFSKGNGEYVFTIEPLFTLFLNENIYKNIPTNINKFSLFSIFNDVHIDQASYTIKCDSIENWIDTIVMNCEKKEIFFYENFIDQIIEESFSRYNNKRTMKIKNLDDFKTLYSHIISRIELFYKDCSGISIESIEINACELNSFYNTILVPFFSSTSFGIREDEFTLENINHKESIIRKTFGGETNYALYILYKKLNQYVTFSSNIKIKHYENEINKILNIFINKLTLYNSKTGYTGYFDNDNIKIVSYYNHKTPDVPEFNVIMLNNNNNIYNDNYHGFMPIRFINNNKLYDTSNISKMIFPDRPYIIKDIFVLLNSFKKISKMISHINILIQKLECLIYTDNLFTKWNEEYSRMSAKSKIFIEELLDSLNYSDFTEYSNYIIDCQCEKITSENTNKSNINFNIVNDSDEIESESNMSDNTFISPEEREFENGKIENIKKIEKPTPTPVQEVVKQEINIIDEFEIQQEETKKIKKKPGRKPKNQEIVITDNEDNKIQKDQVDSIKTSTRKAEKQNIPKEPKELKEEAPVRRRGRAPISLATA